MKEKIREEIKFCEFLIEQEKMQLEEGKGMYLDGYHQGKLSSLEWQVERLKNLLGDE